MTWRKISSAGDMEYGKQYRCVLEFRAPFPNKYLQATYSLAINRAVEIAAPSVHINHPVEFVPVDSGASGRYGLWQVLVPFKKVREGSPLLPILGACAGVFIFLTISRKEIQESVETISNELKQTVFSPGFVLAGFIVAVLALTNK